MGSGEYGLMGFNPNPIGLNGFGLHPNPFLPQKQQQRQHLLPLLGYSGRPALLTGDPRQPAAGGPPAAASEWESKAVKEKKKKREEEEEGEEEREEEGALAGRRRGGAGQGSGGRRGGAG